MRHYQHRVAALERAEWDRVHALPPREWIGPYLTFPRLTPEERQELDTLLSLAFDDRGYVTGIETRMTPAQRERARALVIKGGTT